VKLKSPLTFRTRLEFGAPVMVRIARCFEELVAE